jgi:Beta-lactamase superfamily domain
VPPTRRRILGLLAVAAAAVGVPSIWISRMKTYDGPVSDHFDGLRFFDPDGAPPKSLSEVLRWQLGGDRKRTNWPDWVPSPYADTPPLRVAGDRVRLSFAGHASWLIQTAGLNILIDPVWSARASPFGFAGPKRVNDPGIAFDALPPIDVALVSHGHYDHLDLATLSRLAAKFSPRTITPLGHDAQRRRCDQDRALRLA